MYIALKVKRPDGKYVYFRLKKKTALKKLMDAYCQRESCQRHQLLFLYHGQRVRDDQTPKELEMEEEDVIKAMLL